MLAENLEFLMQVRGLSQSDLARAAGVSRQAVSLWMKQRGPEGISARTPHLFRLADNLDLDVNDLLKPLPDFAEFETALLWDRLYPSLPVFLAACLRAEERALARMIQVYGLLITAKLFGRRVTRDFPKISRFIHPVRRKECELVWKTLTDPM